MSEFNIETATMQEAVDYSVQQIVKQGARCMLWNASTYGSDCAYGDADGNHCAIGWLLDPNNEKLMDIRSEVAGVPKDLLPRLINENIEPFRWVQAFHDTDMGEFRYIELLEKLQGCGIDTTGEWFEQWIKLRLEQEND